MAIPSIILGLIMLGLTGFLFKFGAARNGRVRPFLSTEFAQISYLFGIIICFVIGFFLILSSVG
jgi:hypothetical protein